MPNTPTRNIALTRELDAYIGTQVASGRYSNASEVVRNALQLMIDQGEAQGRRKTAKPQPNKDRH